MSIFRKSEDPWDRKPEKRPPPKEPKANPLDSLKTWNEDRKAAAREKAEAKRLPPEKCPWCGKDMEQGFLSGGRGVFWHSGVYKFSLFRGLDGDSIDVLNEGSFLTAYYKTTWLCRDCKKTVFDMPDPPAVYNPSAGLSETDETKEEEESADETRRI